LSVHDHCITSTTTTTNNNTVNRGTAEHRKHVADASSEEERQRKAHAAQGHSHGTPNPGGAKAVATIAWDELFETRLTFFLGS
jgi:hypothetical protein